MNDPDLEILGSGLEIKKTEKPIENSNLSIIRHPNLDNNPKFLSLKAELEKYYKDCRLPPELQNLSKVRTQR